MKTASSVGAALLLCGILFVPNAVAQQGMQGYGNRGWGTEGAYSRMYDPNTVKTVTGTVTDVKDLTPQQGMSRGIQMTVQTEQERIPVHLGPAWYIDNQNIVFNPGDKVTVKGSRITYNGTPAIIAAEVKKGDRSLTLRDAASGLPVWAGVRKP